MKKVNKKNPKREPQNEEMQKKQRINQFKIFNYNYNFG